MRLARVIPLFTIGFFSALATWAGVTPPPRMAGWRKVSVAADVDISERKLRIDGRARAVRGDVPATLKLVANGGRNTPAEIDGITNDIALGIRK